MTRTLSLVAAVVCIAVATMAFKSLISVRSFAVTVQPSLLDAAMATQAANCSGVIDAGLDAGGCSEDASAYDATAYVGAGSAQLIANADGFNSVLCSNVSSVAVYMGGSTVTNSDGYPICTTAATCAANTLTLDTHLVYATLAARVDGGVELRCIVGN